MGQPLCLYPGTYIHVGLFSDSTEQRGEHYHSNFVDKPRVTSHLTQSLIASKGQIQDSEPWFELSFSESKAHGQS